jgi:chromosome segregation ATPase
VLTRKVDAYASEQAALQGSLDLFKQEHSTLQAQLQSREHEVSTLRAATAQARERIEAVLERLPGAAVAPEKEAQ